MLNLGLDLGTKTIVLARRGEDKRPIFRQEINGFFEFPRPDSFTRNLLVQQQIPFIERDGKIVALGKRAEQLAYAFNSTLRRPMSDGTVSKEQEAINIMASIVHAILGKIEEDTTLYYCIPADAINKTTNVKLHQRIAQTIIEGKKSEAKIMAYPINEARAIAVASGEPVAIACLTPDNVVYTGRGLVKIADIVSGDKVLSRDGEWRSVKSIIGRPKDEEVLRFHIDNTNYRHEVTADHRILIYGDNGWEWRQARDLSIGDIVGEPVVNRHQRRNLINLIDRSGNGQIKQRHIDVSYEMGRFLGYWLADGHVNAEKGYIRIDFGPEETELFDDASSIIGKLMDRSVQNVAGDRNNLRLSFDFKALAGWLKSKCYRDNLKTIPFDIETLSIPAIYGLIQGLIAGDGWVCNDQIGFSTTSQYLAQQFHLMLGMIGISSGLQPREGRAGKIDGRAIMGGPSYQVIVTGLDRDRLAPILATDPGSNKRMMLGGYRCGQIREITKRHYNGMVYDLEVDGEPSFTLPGMVVHNCSWGAGMVNVCYSMFGVVPFEFSVVGSGDWIDCKSAEAFGYDPTNPNIKYHETPTTICKQKQRADDPLDLSRPVNGISRVDQVITLNYHILIENVIGSIIEGFNSNYDRARIEQAIPIVMAGGTAIPKGFKEAVEKALGKQKLPFEVSKVIVHDTPLFAVAEGCLVAAENHS